MKVAVLQREDPAVLLRDNEAVVQEVYPVRDLVTGSGAGAAWFKDEAIVSQFCMVYVKEQQAAVKLVGRFKWTWVGPAPDRRYFSLRVDRVAASVVADQLRAVSHEELLA